MCGSSRHYHSIAADTKTRKINTGCVDAASRNKTSRISWHSHGPCVHSVRIGFTMFLTYIIIISSRFSYIPVTMTPRVRAKTGGLKKKTEGLWYEFLAEGLGFESLAECFGTSS